MQVGGVCSLSGRVQQMEAIGNAIRAGVVRLPYVPCGKRCSGNELSTLLQHVSITVRVTPPLYSKYEWKYLRAKPGSVSDMIA